MSLDVPVVLFFFNRAEHLAKVFARVREVKPRHLVLVGDGPRADRVGEAAACEATRAVVADVDWACEVTRVYADTNMGCRDRIASGIRAAFERYETAIFLEDDCLPRRSFFPYCAELLERYRDDEAVGFVSGTRFIRLPDPGHPGHPGDGASYQFCQMPLVWGWASWRRALVGYDERMPTWGENEAAVRAKLKDAMPSSMPPAIAHRVVESVMSAQGNCYRGTLDTWDHPLAYHLLMNDRKCIIPRTNLVTNIGFGQLSTHTQRIATQAALRSEEIGLPLVHPADTAIDRSLDAAVWKNAFCHPMLGEPRVKRWLHHVVRSWQEWVFQRRGGE